MFILSKPTTSGELVRLSKKYLLCRTQAQFKIAGPQKKSTENELSIVRTPRIFCLSEQRLEASPHSHTKQ